MMNVVMMNINVIMIIAYQRIKFVMAKMIVKMVQMKKIVLILKIRMLHPQTMIIKVRILIHSTLFPSPLFFFFHISVFLAFYMFFWLFTIHKQTTNFHAFSILFLFSFLTTCCTCSSLTFIKNK